MRYFYKLRAGPTSAVPGSGSALNGDLHISHEGDFEAQPPGWDLTEAQALAQDQRAALEQLLCNCAGLEHIQVSTYDGDTPQELRRGKTANTYTSGYC